MSNPLNNFKWDKNQNINSGGVLNTFNQNVLQFTTNPFIKNVRTDNIIVNEKLILSNDIYFNQNNKLIPLHLQELTVSGQLNLQELTVSGPVNLQELTVSGQVNLQELNINNLNYNNITNIKVNPDDSGILPNQLLPSNQILLPNDFSPSNDFYVNDVILIYISEFIQINRAIIAYDGTTKIATLDSNIFLNTPLSGFAFEIYSGSFVTLNENIGLAEYPIYIPKKTININGNNINEVYFPKNITISNNKLISNINPKIIISISIDIPNDDYQNSFLNFKKTITGDLIFIKVFNNSTVDFVGTIKVFFWILN